MDVLMNPPRPEPPLDPNWQPPDWFVGWQEEAKRAEALDVYEVYFPPEDPWSFLAIGEWKRFTCPKGQAPSGPDVYLVPRRTVREKIANFQKAVTWDDDAPKGE